MPSPTPPDFEHATVLDASRNLERVVAKVSDGRVAGVVLTRGNQPSAVLISPDIWEKALGAMERLSESR